MNEGLKNWNTTPDGAVKFDYAIEVGVTSANPFEIVLRVDYATSQDHLDRVKSKKSKPRRIQVSMPPEKAAALAELLLLHSKGLQSTIPTKDKQN
jgi:hypothetical protein